MKSVIKKRCACYVIKGKKENSAVNIDFYYEIVNHASVR
jgi:hypothetical protein